MDPSRSFTPHPFTGAATTPDLLYSQPNPLAKKVTLSALACLFVLGCAFSSALLVTMIPTASHYAFPILGGLTLLSSIVFILALIKACQKPPKSLDTPPPGPFDEDFTQ